MNLAKRYPHSCKRHRHLTDRQHQIALLVAAGLSNRQIAKLLGITENGVKQRLYLIYDIFDLGMTEQNLAKRYPTSQDRGVYARFKLHVLMRKHHLREIIDLSRGCLFCDLMIAPGVCRVGLIPSKRVRSARRGSKSGLKSRIARTFRKAKNR